LSGGAPSGTGTVELASGGVGCADTPPAVIGSAEAVGPASTGPSRVGSTEIPEGGGAGEEAGVVGTEQAVGEAAEAEAVEGAGGVDGLVDGAEVAVGAETPGERGRSDKGEEAAGAERAGMEGALALAGVTMVVVVAGVEVVVVEDAAAAAKEAAEEGVERRHWMSRISDSALACWATSDSAAAMTRAICRSASVRNRAETRWSRICYHFSSHDGASKYEQPGLM